VHARVSLASDIPKRARLVSVLELLLLVLVGLRGGFTSSSSSAGAERKLRNLHLARASGHAEVQTIHRSDSCACWFGLWDAHPSRRAVEEGLNGVGLLDGPCDLRTLGRGISPDDKMLL
jgi:hypothetical protein